MSPKISSSNIIISTDIINISTGMRTIAYRNLDLLITSKDISMQAQLSSK